jgi:glycosyl transferase family 25
MSTSTPSPLLPIYVISLERCQDKRSIFAKWNDPHIDYQFYDACDGMQLSKSRQEEHSRLGSWSVGAYGCAVSHKELWKKCIQTQQPMIILEDDVVVNQHFQDQVAQIQCRLPTNWDLCLFAFNHDSAVSYRDSTGDNCMVYFQQKTTNDEIYAQFQKQTIDPALVKLNFACGLCAYMLRPSGARALLANATPLKTVHPFTWGLPLSPKLRSTQIDVLSTVIYSELNSYITLNPIAMSFHMDSEYQSSTS